MSTNQKDSETTYEMEARGRGAFMKSFVIMSIFLQGVNLALLFTGRIDVVAYGLVAVFGEFIVLLFATFIHMMSL